MRPLEYRLLYYRVRSVRYGICVHAAQAGRGSTRHRPGLPGRYGERQLVSLHHMQDVQNLLAPGDADHLRRASPRSRAPSCARSKTPEETTSARKLHRRDRITAADPRVLESSSARLRHESARLEDTAKPAGHRHEPPRLPARLGANPEHTEPRMGWNGSEPLPPATVALVASLQPSIHGQRRADAATIRWHQPRSIFG